MNLQRKVSDYKQTNTYFLWSSSELVIVDPGVLDVKRLISFIDSNDFTQIKIILTHEHIDHVYSLNELSNLTDIEVFASELTAQNVKSAKENLSKYTPDLSETTVEMQIKTLNHNEIVNLGTFQFEHYHIPGHSPGSSLFKFGNYIFTGDSYLLDYPVHLSFPHSNKTDYLFSRQLIENMLHEHVVICPGHGNAFDFYQQIIPIKEAYT